MAPILARALAQAEPVTTLAALMKDKVLIANGQGFWGDSILGPVRLVNEGPLDYLTLDYLAEVTLSIMQKLRARRPGTRRWRS